MGCFFNKPPKEPENYKNSNRKLFQRNILHTSIEDKKVNRKKQYEVSTTLDSGVSLISIMDLVLNLDSLNIEASITKTHKIEHYHDVIPFIEHYHDVIPFIEHYHDIIPFIEHYHDIIPFIELQMKKKNVENMDKSKENKVMMHHKNNIKQPEIGFKLSTNSVDYEKEIRLQKELINNIFHCEYIKQQELDNLFRNDNCVLNTQPRNNISRFS
jgi:hypothetical protein